MMSNAARDCNPGTPAPDDRKTFTKMLVSGRGSALRWSALALAPRGASRPIRCWASVVAQPPRTAWGHSSAHAVLSLQLCPPPCHLCVLFGPALLYHAAVMAERLPFADLWNHLARYVGDEVSFRPPSALERYPKGGGDPLVPSLTANTSFLPPFSGRLTASRSCST